MMRAVSSAYSAQAGPMIVDRPRTSFVWPGRQSRAVRVAVHVQIYTLCKTLSVITETSAAEGKSLESVSPLLVIGSDCRGLTAGVFGWFSSPGLFC